MLRFQRLLASLNLRRQGAQNGAHFGMLAAAALQTVKGIPDSLRTKRILAPCDLRSQGSQHATDVNVAELPFAAPQAIQGHGDILCSENVAT